MISKKITKNINKQKTGPFNLSISQMIAGIIGAVVGVATFFLLKDYIPFDGLIWIIFFELIIVIGIGVVKVYDMNLFQLLFKMLRGAEKRPYSNRKGVYDKDDFSIF